LLIGRKRFLHTNRTLMNIASENPKTHVPRRTEDAAVNL
jgi:hypothetical protein